MHSSVTPISGYASRSSRWRRAPPRQRHSSSGSFGCAGSRTGGSFNSRWRFFLNFLRFYASAVLDLSFWSPAEILPTPKRSLLAAATPGWTERRSSKCEFLFPPAVVFFSHKFPPSPAAGQLSARQGPAHRAHQHGDPARSLWRAHGAITVCETLLRRALLVQLNDLPASTPAAPAGLTAATDCVGSFWYATHRTAISCSGATTGWSWPSPPPAPCCPPPRSRSCKRPCRS